MQRTHAFLSARVWVLFVGVLLLALLLMSVGHASTPGGQKFQIVLRRGALELAFCTHPMTSHERDSWVVGGAWPPDPRQNLRTHPILVGMLAPRTFLFPTSSHDQFGMRDPKTFQYTSPVMTLSVIHVPLVPPLLVCLLLALWLWWPHLRVRRGLCRNCRYDLTGNVSGRCPECGETTTPRLAAGRDAA